MNFDIDRRKLLKATGAGLATVTIVSGKAGAVTDIGDLPGDGDQQNPYEIGSFEDMLAIDQDLDANYILTDHIEFEEETPIPPLAFEDAYSAGNSAFTGTLDGQGYEIRSFEIEGFSYYSDAGLFGNIGEGGTVRNLNVVDIDVSGDDAVGALVGRFEGGEEGAIENVSITGNVNATNPVGGIVGRMVSGTVADCGSSANVQGSGSIGGIVGLMEGGDITRTYAKGDVSSQEGGNTNEGGFVGLMDGGEITLSFATGNVFGSLSVGGFVGNLRSGRIEKAYTWGDVGCSEDRVGGFAGRVEEGEGFLEEVYSVGSVCDAEKNDTGGLVGTAITPESVDIAEDSVSALDQHVTHGYWDVPASNQETSAGGVGLGDIDDEPPADEMTGNDAPNNMDGFDFDNTWVTVTGNENIVIGAGSYGSFSTHGVRLTQNGGGDGYPIFGWQVEDKPECVDRRNLGRGQEDDECPGDRDLRRGETRRELDRQTGRGGGDEHRDSATSRRDRGR